MFVLEGLIILPVCENLYFVVQILAHNPRIRNQKEHFYI